jgi:WD40 repeat protein
MDSVPGNSFTPVSQAHTPTPSELDASITPTNFPLRWITPTNSNLGNSSNLATDGSAPKSAEASPSPTLDDYPASTAEIATKVPSKTPTKISTAVSTTPSATQIPVNTPTQTPTGVGAYPGPDPTDDPYPGPGVTATPIATNDPYPGPGDTSTPPPTSTPTVTSSIQQPTATVPAAQPSPTPNHTPTPKSSLLPTNTPPPVITTLPFTETQILSNGPVNQAIWLDDDNSLGLATSNGLYLHNLSSGRSKILDARFPMSSVAYIPDDLIAAGGQDSVIRIWDTYDNGFVTSLSGHLLGVIRLAYSQPGDFLASASDDATIRIWDYDGSPLYTFRNSVTRIMDMALSPNGQMVAAASNRHMHIWRPLSGELSKTITQPDGWYTAVTFSPNSQILTTAFDGRRLEFWNTSTWERINFIGLDTEVLSLAYSPEGTMLAVSFENDNIHIFDAVSLFVIADFAGHNNLTSMTFSPTNDQLLTSSADGSIRVWDVSPLLNP